MISDRTATIVVFVVLAVWVVTIGVSMIPGSGYHPPATINGAFMIVVGGAFMAWAKGGSNGEKKE